MGQSLHCHTGNHRFVVPVRKGLHSHDCFFQIDGWCVAGYTKTFVLLYLLFKVSCEFPFFVGTLDFGLNVTKDMHENQ